LGDESRRIRSERESDRNQGSLYDEATAQVEPDRPTVAPNHPKAMPVILATDKECDV
jgi:hypothetical protein